MADQAQADGACFPPHPLRAILLHEAHARPFVASRGEVRFLHFAFATDEDEARVDRRALQDLCIARGVQGPSEDARHFSTTFDEGGFRWEQHAEFTTHTWSLPIADNLNAQRRGRLSALRPTGPHLVSVDLVVSKQDLTEAAGFEPASLAMAHVYDRAATAASDFKADADGFVRIVVCDKHLSDIERGSLAQRLLELETYRMLALLGLIEAQRLAPSVSVIERDLTALTSEITEPASPENDERLLQRLTELAARLEAGAAASLYRFGASRAYAEIVQGRLTAIGEKRSQGISTLSEFLGRRLAPAMRTCTTLEERQANLSRKLARAAQLLRTRVDVELARQNRDLLTAMNERTLMQHRLQAVVEGLSIAAISYYVLGLLKYPIEAVHGAYRNIDDRLIMALATPVVLAAVWRFLALARRRLEAEGRTSN